MKRNLTSISIGLIFTILIIFLNPFTIYHLTYNFGKHFSECRDALYSNKCISNYNKAEKTYKIGIWIEEHLPIKIDNFTVRMLYELAQNQAYNQHKTDEAKESLNKAIDILKCKHKDSKTGIIAGHTIDIGNIYEEEKNYKQAENKYLEAIEIAKTNEQKNYEVLIEAYDNLAELYVKQELYTERSIEGNKEIAKFKKFMKRNPKNIKREYLDLALKIMTEKNKYFCNNPNRYEFLKNNQNIINAEKYLLTSIELIKKYAPDDKAYLNYYKARLARFYKDIGLQKSK